jgi:tetratricopeptide (TPR) repeat protein
MLVGESTGELPGPAARRPGGGEGRGEEMRYTGRSLRILFWASAAVLVLSCAPSLVMRKDFSRNPVEIIDESPRVYRIKFESFADSLETLRARTYLMESLPEGFSIPQNLDDLEVSRKDSALIEYGKALKRLNASANKAALQHITRSLELDPTFLPSYVVLARLFVADGQIMRAKELLDRVLEWDPSNSRALVELAKCRMYMGQLDSAREALVGAVIFDRADLDAWGELTRLGLIQNFDVATRDAPELAFVEKARGRNHNMILDSSLVDCPVEASAWIVFASQRAVWKYEGKYQQRFSDSHYRRTYDEDVDCYMSLAVAWKVLAESSDSMSCDREYLDFLTEVSDGGYLVPHVLMDYICLANPRAAKHFPVELIERMRDYVDKYVIIYESDES